MSPIIVHDNGTIIVEACLGRIAAPQESFSILQEVSCYFLGQRFLLSGEETVVPPKSEATFSALTEKALVIGGNRMTTAGAFTNSGVISSFSSVISVVIKRFFRSSI